MKFRVTVPDDVPEQTVRVRCPDGTETTVKIPKGLQKGDTFIFELQEEQLRNPKILLETLNNNNNKKKNRRNGSNSDGNGGMSGIMTLRQQLDDFFTIYEDVILAVAAGVIIGLSLVFGFMCGILYATRDYFYTHDRLMLEVTNWIDSGGAYV